MLRGNHLVEVRPAGVNKGSAVLRVLPQSAQEGAKNGVFVFAAGDDRTDEDLFRRLPEGATSVLVGQRESAAQLRVGTPAELRELLGGLLAALTPQHRSAAG